MSCASRSTRRMLRASSRCAASACLTVSFVMSAILPRYSARSLWLTGLKETVDQLPDFVRLAARIGVREVYLQRLVFDDLGRGLARSESSLFEKTQAKEEVAIAAAQKLGRELGVTIDASG